MRKKLIDLIEDSGMVENRHRCEIIADELLAAGVCFAPVALVIRKDITDDMLRQMQNALAMPGMIMPYNPEQEIVEIIPRWIPVTERLPQEDLPLGALCEVVQVLLKDGTVTVGFCNRGFRAWFYLPIEKTKFVGHEYEKTPVIAWQPLAQPPKEVQE